MSTPIDVDRVRELLDRRAQLVEVLPAAEYRDEHLPGAINLPLKRLDGPTAEAALNRRRAVIVYCWDSL